MSIQNDAIAQENAQAVVDEPINEVAPEPEPVDEPAPEPVAEPEPMPEPVMSFDEKLTNARSRFDAADTSLERAEVGVTEVMQSIENADARMIVMRETLGSKVSDRDTVKQDAMDASENVEALHREYRRSLS